MILISSQSSFWTESFGEKITKIGQELAKLWHKMWKRSCKSFLSTSTNLWSAAPSRDVIARSTERLCRIIKHLHVFMINCWASQDPQDVLFCPGRSPGPILTKLTSKCSLSWALNAHISYIALSQEMTKFIILPQDRRCDRGPGPWALVQGL